LRCKKKLIGWVSSKTCSAFGDNVISLQGIYKVLSIVIEFIEIPKRNQGKDQRTQKLVWSQCKGNISIKKTRWLHYCWKLQFRPEYISYQFQTKPFETRLGTGFLIQIEVLFSKTSAYLGAIWWNIERITGYDQ
jgi:hypothetical protein